MIALCLAGLAWALSRRPWHWLRRDALQHGWLGALVLLALLWTVRATLPGGLVIQLFGATLMVTLFGLPLALLSLFVVDLVSWLGLGYLAGQGWAQLDWALLWPRYVWMGLLPALLSAALQGAMRRLLPRHPFVFILGHGYFTAGLAALGAGAARALWRSYSAGGSVLSLPDTLIAVLILAFGEAFLTGMLVAVFVVYKPEWVVTFRDEEYLGN
ncbi:energy-coupling factor ABC transporter permease [Cupriavidus basilensis]